MNRRFIGESIIDAINWTQDRLGSTRPIAEAVLFSLLTEKKAKETTVGFMLFEDDDDDDDKIQQLNRVANKRMVRRGRLNMYNRRKSFAERTEILAERFKNPDALRAFAMGYTNEGEILEHPDGPVSPVNRGTNIEAIVVEKT